MIIALVRFLILIARKAAGITESSAVKMLVDPGSLAFVNVVTAPPVRQIVPAALLKPSACVFFEPSV